MRRHSPGARRAFTIVELLAVIAIMMVVMALALPNFIAMSKQRKWTSAVADTQGLVWRARAIATNVRKDMAVEFDIQGDCGTWMWVESESNLVERLPDLNWLQYNLGGGGAIYWILSGEWYNSGGTYTWDNPYYSNLTINPANTRPQSYGDNARQTEVLKIGGSLTIDDSSAASPGFVNWDSPQSVRTYGSDGYKDIRIAPNGALVQTVDPTICFRMVRSDEFRRVQVVRCTGRLVPTR